VKETKLLLAVLRGAEEGIDIFQFYEQGQNPNIFYETKSKPLFRFRYCIGGDEVVESLTAFVHKAVGSNQEMPVHILVCLILKM